MKKVLSGLVLVLALTSCGLFGPKIEGKWILEDIDIQLSDQVPAEKRDFMNQMFSMMKEVMIGQMFMDFKEDGTFVSGSPNPETGGMTERPGNFIFEDGQLITTEMNDGTELKDTVLVNFEGDDVFTFHSEEKEGKMTMKFKRAE